MSSKKKGMSREDAAELYSDLRKALAQTKGDKPAAPKPGNPVAKQIAAEISKALSGDKAAVGAKATKAAAPATPNYSFDPDTVPAPGARGAATAVGFVLLFGLMRIAMTGMEALGIVGVNPAEASIKPVVAALPFGKEEIRILTTLDSRRAELADKSKQIEDREKSLDQRDREFAVRVVQLKELTDQLKSEREKGDKKRSAQIDQLANVYGSMSAQEAAQLMEQLDVQIALSLIERMPEKKIGQILALMSKERALMLTKMLSGKAAS